MSRGRAGRGSRFLHINHHRCDPKRLVAKEPLGSPGSQVHGVVSERPDLDADSERIPRSVESRRECVDRMMNVDCEIEEPAGRKHPNEFVDDRPRFACMINYVVTQNHVERTVRERKRLANSRHERGAALPFGKQQSVFPGKWINTGTGAGTEEENQTMRAAANFKSLRVLRNRAHGFQTLANPPGAILHPRHDLLLPARERLDFRPLIPELASERPLGAAIPGAFQPARPNPIGMPLPLASRLLSRVSHVPGL